MKITQEMIDDWRHKDGFIDFNPASDIYDMRAYPYRDNLAILRYEMGVTISARNWRSGKREFGPIWLNPNHLAVGEILREDFLQPEFSLDEISLGEELIRG